MDRRFVPLSDMLTCHNHHNHGVSGAHHIPRFVCSKVSDTLDVNPTLTTVELAAGQGLSFRPGSADLYAG